MAPGKGFEPLWLEEPLDLDSGLFFKVSSALPLCHPGCVHKKEVSLHLKTFCCSLLVAVPAPKGISLAGHFFFGVRRNDACVIALNVVARCCTRALRNVTSARAAVCPSPRRNSWRCGNRQETAPHRQKRKSKGSEKNTFNGGFPKRNRPNARQIVVGLLFSSQV